MYASDDTGQVEIEKDKFDESGYFYKIHVQYTVQ